MEYLITVLLLASPLDLNLLCINQKESIRFAQVTMKDQRMEIGMLRYKLDQALKDVSVCDAKIEMSEMGDLPTFLKDQNS